MDANMIQAFLSGLVSVFTWPTFGLMVMGIVIGFIVGILPGVGGVVALAVLLPFTYSLEPAAAFALLLSTVTVLQNSSDITSILFGVPGDASSAAVVVDGYPMAKKGEAGRALSGNLLASLIGAAVGAFAIALAIPIVRPLVLSLGSPEFFFLTIFGILLVSVLSAGATLKGLMGGLFGLAISFIGLDPQGGFPRYTFGRAEFWDGLHLVPVALGIFALPSLFELCSKGGTIAEASHRKIVGIWEGIRDVWKHFWLVARCSLLGTGIGIFPGLGGPLAQWVAYAHAVQSSPDKERFGKGAPEGALGPGATNNSGLGGALIPTIAFGVPGNLPMAILLGAFLIQGLNPGPEMLTRHLDLTMSFVWIIVISNVIVFILAMPLLKQLAKITLVRGDLLVPIMCLFVLIGAYASRNSFFNVGVMLIAGLFGIAFYKYGWPRPPVIMGLVLGGLSERYLFISYARYGFGFLVRPFVLVAIALLILGVVLKIVIPRWKAYRGTPHRRVSLRVSLPLRYTPNTVVAIVILVLAAMGVWLAQDWPFHARMMPLAAGVPLVVLCVTYLVVHTLGIAEDGRGRYEMTPSVVSDARDQARRSIFFIVWLGAFSVSAWALGFSVSAPILTLAYAKLLGRERWLVAGVLCAIAAAVVWLAGVALGIPLPAGRLPRLLFGQL